MSQLSVFSGAVGSVLRKNMVNALWMWILYRALRLCWLLVASDNYEISTVDIKTMAAVEEPSAKRQKVEEEPENQDDKDVSNANGQAKVW